VAGRFAMPVHPDQLSYFGVDILVILACTDTHKSDGNLPDKLK
jgi:hypothetical protein